MKHIFIINPMAGSGKHVEELRRKLFEIDSVDWEIYETKYPKDATNYIISYCSTHTEPVRFYACGGDGTIKEVADGVVQFPFAEMSCYPCGSGNDFVKCFGGQKCFSDLSELISATAKPIDIIKVGETYSINVVNFGFDACVAKTMINVKRRKLIGGRNAYTTGIMYSLFKAMKNKADVYVDGEKISKETFLLCTVANGQYVGGSFRCAPRAILNDGAMDVCLVNSISRFKLVKLIKYYSRGLHLDNDKFSDIVVYRRARSVRIVAPEGFYVSVDGEIYDYNDFSCEILHNAIKFAAPCDPIVSSTCNSESYKQPIC